MSHIRTRKHYLHRAILESLEPRHLLSTSVLTWHNDLGRTGLNPSEQILTPANVNSSSFGELLSYQVSGQVYAQPLYVPNLAIPGKGAHNVVFVATMTNDLYAFDANSNAGVGQGLLWHVNLGTPAAVPSPFIGFRYGPDHDTTPYVGITSTPVIDPATGIIYVDAFTNDIVGQDAYSHHIHAIDIATGQDKVTPMLVTASVLGNGVGGNGTTVPFAANRQIQRAALTLLNGTLYASYAAFADTDPYHGWVLGFDASSLQLKSVYNTTPNLDTDAHEGESGIWMSGAGPASDGTNLFFITGNGDFNPAVGDYGDSILQVRPDSSTSGSPNINGYGLFTADYFTPYNQQALADADADLGSGGAMLLPTSPGGTPELVGAGKQGIIYLINLNNMGHYTSSGTVNNDIQEVALGHGVWGSPAYFNASIYYHAVGDVLKRFSISNGTLSAAPAAQSTITYNSQGSTPSISSNGVANGIVWDIQWDAGHQVLHAYDATTLTQLFNSNQNATRDQMSAGVKFITPTIADGEVFVGGNGMLYIYGLLKPVTSAPPAPSALAADAVSSSIIHLTWIDNADNESSFSLERSTDGVNFTPIATLSANTVSFNDNVVSPNTTYYYRVSAANVIGVSDYSNTASATTPASTGATDVYHFDASTGTSVLDANNNNNGQLTGTTLPQWAPGRIGNALSFSGNGVFNSTANQSAVTVSNDFAPLLGSTATFDVWIKTTQKGSNTHYQAPAVTGVDQAGGVNDINWGTIDATGHIGLYVGDSGGVYSTNPINDGQWHNVAMTRDAATGLVQIFVDGLLNSSATLPAGNMTSSFFVIGALTDVANDGITKTGANYFNGSLDEIRIYNQVLGLSEIIGMAQPPTAPLLNTATAEAGPVVHLTFTSPSFYAVNLEIDRKTGVNGTYAPIATVPASTTVFDDTQVAAGTAYYYTIKAIDLAGSSLVSNELAVMPPAPTIVGRVIFYNNSIYDSNNGSSNLTDDKAIATDKQALLPGQSASFSNYISSPAGITGIMIDVANLVVLPRLDDFMFAVGNASDTSSWATAPTPALINTYPGRGPNGSTQITIIWDPSVIQNEWLKVTVLAQPHLGLLADDVFYFGNAVGDTGDSSTDAQTTAADVNAVSAHTGPAGITNPYDFNRDGVVDATDVSIAQNNQTPPGTALQLITPTDGTDIPVVAAPASASPLTVDNKTTTLSVLGADLSGETGLTYTWSAIGTPPGPVSFSVNSSNAAKNVTATFSAAGTYTLQVTITNGANNSVTSDVTVQVNQTSTAIVVTPAAAAIPANLADLLSATELDQFNHPMAVQPSFAWTVSSGAGAISAAGLFTAPRSAGTSTVTASADGLSGNAVLTVYYEALAWYPADAATGTTLTDASPFAQNASLSGAASFAAGVSNNALLLNGGYATLPQAIVSSLNDFTISSWIKPTTLNNWSRIFDFGSGVNNYMFLTPSAGGTGALRFAITAAGNGSEQQLNGPALTVNTWYHVAVTLAGNTATLYVNGQPVATNTSMTLHPTNLGATTQDYLGKSQFNADPNFAGSIDDFRLYSRALSASEILKLAVPAIISPPAAADSTVTGTSTALSVSANDITAGESALTYTWAATGTPPGSVSFSTNGTNAAKNTTATFTAVGTYTLQVTITNPLATVSTAATVDVTVVQTASGFAVLPSTASIVPGGTLELGVGIVDQFGNSMGAATPGTSITWSILSGQGSILPNGAFVASASPGTTTIQASDNAGHSATASISIAAATAFYQANASSGSNLADSSGNNNNASLSGSTSFSPGVSGNAISFSGGFAQLPNNITSSLSDFTIAA
ncbi:MAG: LamG-like jellyroll fold domain-containing protein, partial [Phycisphaerae bacterium]